jgi:hypothetical protein
MAQECHVTGILGELVFPVNSLFLTTRFVRDMGEKLYTVGIYGGAYPAKDVGDAVIPCIFPCCREFSAEKGSR